MKYTRTSSGRIRIEEPVTLEELIYITESVIAGELFRPDAEPLKDPHMAGRYLQAKLSNREREVFAVLFLDTRHRVRHYEEMFFGTIDGAEVHPREVVRAALTHNAAAVILGHNHPSGNSEPSAADRAVTARLKQALALVDVRLMDHFVIGAGAPVSLASRGWV